MTHPVRVPLPERTDSLRDSGQREGCCSDESDQLKHNSYLSIPFTKRGLQPAP